MADINDLLKLMAMLRDPDNGCPWDLKQNFQTIAPYTLEEACEVVDAIEQEDYPHLREELGDLLFQVVFHGQMATEAGYFNFGDIVNELVEKLIRRHPHVFPDGTLESGQHQNRLTPEQVKERWQAIKQEEKKQKQQKKAGRSDSALPDTLPATLPALKKAEKIQQAAAQVGFDWQEPSQVVEKIHEELAEIEQAYHQESQQRVEEEVGDLLFACVNYARHLKVDPEMALRKASSKFDGRFRLMEGIMKEDHTSFGQLSLAEMEAYWQKAKG